MADRTVSQRFNEFHLAVALYSERTRWILSKLDISQEGVDLLTHLADELEHLVLEADCRPDGIGERHAEVVEGVDAGR